ncbi:MAG: carbohydrate-binding family 9-like protein [Alistipes sp.]
MKIPRFTIDSQDAKQMDDVFKLIVPQPIACNNWAVDYPYTPRVEFRMLHTGTQLCIRFEVAEHSTAAVVVADQGEVWTDSCVEFFLAVDDSGYYNFETNCIGTMLLAFRKERPTPEYAPVEVMHAVRRISTLSRASFVERQGDNHWSLTLVIPPEALFRHAFSSWDGLRARMNLYKCGDHLSPPHFLSWRPIATTRPDFHRPEFFVPVDFAE